MKSKLALLLATLLFFNIVLPIRVHAAVVPDISQVTAVWDPYIDTSWDHVYLEYKTLDPQSRYEADKVIAANAYRFLISIGSKQLEDINQQKFDDFLRAVSPFNIAYNNVLAEQVVHAAWSISGEQYKVFCANVIHNIASNPDYYITHIIKNDPFVNGAGRQSLQVQYNDVDIDQSLNIYNNIFTGNVLSSSSGAVGFWYNPLPLNYNGIDISLEKLNAFRDISSMCLFSNKSSNDVLNRNLYYRHYSNAFGLLVINCYINSDNTYSFTTDRVNRYLNLSNYLSPSVSEYSNGFYFQSSVLQFSDLDSLKRDFYSWFNDYLSNYLVYAESIMIYITLPNMQSVTLYLPFPSGTSFVSPQFHPVNIYNNQYYGSDDDTYFYVDQMVDNIINNDYSTVNNGSNNTFYNDNYYITQPVSGGGIELVTSSSIVYNYITIINNGGGNTSGGSIGSYPYPFDVRIINPEDIKNETEVNTQNEIINNYDLDINAGNLTPTITTVKNTAVNNLNEVAPTTGSSIAWIPFMFSAIPPDLMKIILSFLIVGVIVCVYHSK